MSSENAAAAAGQDPTGAAPENEDPKGKGKAVASNDPAADTMDEDDDDDDDDEDDNEAGDAGETEEGMEEIDTGNIVEGGRRTRGRVIDWAKAAQEHPAEDDDEDDEDEFEPEQEGDDKMEE